MTDQTKCPECHATSSVVASALDGFGSCEHCGKVFPLPDGVSLTESEEVEAREPTLADLADTEFVIPDGLEPVYGWRAWGVKKDWERGKTPLLRSVTHSEAFWTPRMAMQATCPYGRGRANGRKPGKGHECPDEHCSCGLYSAKTLDHLLGMSYHKYDAERNGMFHCIGKVKLWGKVIQGSQGWRAEFGYPDTIYVPYEAAKDLAEPLEQTYGVEIGLKNWLGSEITKIEEE